MFFFSLVLYKTCKCEHNLISHPWSFPYLCKPPHYSQVFQLLDVGCGDNAKGRLKEGLAFICWDGPCKRTEGSGLPECHESSDVHTGALIHVAFSQPSVSFSFHIPFIAVFIVFCGGIPAQEVFKSWAEMTYPLREENHSSSLTSVFKLHTFPPHTPNVIYHLYVNLWHRAWLDFWHKN